MDASITLFRLHNYRIVLLNEKDETTLQSLLEKCDDYHMLVFGKPVSPSDACDLLTSLPPHKEIADKFTIGIYQPTAGLVGVLDTVRDYPRAAAWWIGLLLLAPGSRGHGLGEQVYKAFEHWITGLGAQSIFLGVVERNLRAYAFWEKMGFYCIEQTPPRQFGRIEQAVTIMQRSISESR